MRSVNSEEALYEEVAAYLRIRYPRVKYHFDLSGLWTPSHRLRNLYGRLNDRAWPDLFIAKTVYLADTIEIAAGLFLELKREGTRIKKRDGTWANDHIAEQAAKLEELADQGYIAQFATGLEEATKLIDSYMVGMQ